MKSKFATQFAWPLGACESVSDARNHYFAVAVFNVRSRAVFNTATRTSWPWMLGRDRHI